MTDAQRAERKAAMASLYATGATLQEIGDVFGVSRERVRQIINQPRDGARARVDPLVILAAARAGGVASLSAVAQRAHCSRAGVERALRAMGCWPAVRRLWRWRRSFALRQRQAAWLDRYRAESARFGRPLTAPEILALGGGKSGLFGRHYVAKIRHAVGETADVRRQLRLRKNTTRTAILALLTTRDTITLSAVAAAVGTSRKCVYLTARAMVARGELRVAVSRRGWAGESEYALAESLTTRHARQRGRGV